MFFAEAGDITGLMPWTYAHCMQASDAVRDVLAPHIVDSQPFTTLISDLHESVEQLTGRLDTSRARNIRRGESLPMEMAINQVSRQDAYTLLARFYQERGVRQPDWDYFTLIAQRCDIWSTTLEGRLATIDVVLRDYPDRVRVMYGCHNVACELSGAQRGAIASTVHWKQVLEYKRQGFHWYDWGGIVTDRDSPYYGITKFKLAFGGVERTEWNLTLAGSVVRPVLHLAYAWQQRRNASPGAVRCL
jgi:hypothetical protein